MLGFFENHGNLAASLGVKIELACEINPEAMAVYRKNVRPVKTHGDICTLDCSQTKVDFVTVGLLCQAFSPAGNGLGFADPVLANATGQPLPQLFAASPRLPPRQPSTPIVPALFFLPARSRAIPSLQRVPSRFS